MKKIIAFALVTIASSTLFAKGFEVIPQKALPFMRESNIMGLAVSVCDGEHSTTMCFGKASQSPLRAVSAKTLFALASLTKVITATDLALHIDDGQMRLDDPITCYLPRLTDNPYMHEITLKDLASHTSSLPRNIPKPYNQQALLHFLQNFTPQYPIGTKYLYSNLGFGLLGYALENTTTSSYKDLLQKDLFLPLGMTSTMVGVSDAYKDRCAQGYSEKNLPVSRPFATSIPAAGAIWSTPIDMCKFLQANLGIAHSLSPQMNAMRLAQQGYFKVNDKLTMALGWQRVRYKGRRLIDKNGSVSGFSSYIGMLPNKKIGIVLLANRERVNLTRFGRKLLVELDS